ncbi:FecR family protein [Pedobacter sp. ASV28]|uniref:FecR family protein n=1 Tax=Pedobacter sp. ASV28 TaxID=2795123 RepID=UPI0018ED5249|nr:FecR family protein [Pedobacter sp. ASV28]
MKTLKLADALARKMQGIATEADDALINDWLNANQENRWVYERILNDEEGVLEELRQVDSHSALNRVHRRAAKARRRKRLLVAVAAAILMAVGIFVIPRTNHKEIPKSLAQTDSIKEILPASDRAILITGDGSRLELKENGDTSFVYGDLQIVQEAGRLSYRTDAGSAIVEQQLITPNAGKYNMVLPDGSRVWLNAASTLKFPNRFTGKERVVELDGEGFFEVSKDAQHPFMVLTNGGSKVEVLGTVFNVKGYGMEKISTTLLEGSVKVSSNGATAIIKPGQVADALATGIKVGMGDIAAATAWRKDKFIFHNMPIWEMMEELSRWYDVKIVYDESYKQQQELYNGEIGRSVTLEKLLAMLEQTGVAHFKLKERTLYIRPY